MFKNLLLILLFALLSSLAGFGQGTWKKIKTPTDFNLLKVCYLDSLHCWVAGDSGVIMFSSDQGLTWEIQHSGVANYIHDIFFIDENFGWAITNEVEGINFDSQGKILKTVNGGVDWEILNYRHLNIELNTIFFLDSNNGWLGGNFELGNSTNGGLDWTTANIFPDTFAYFPVRQIRFSTPEYGFAIGGHVDAVGVAWSTSDGGQTWLPHGIGPDLFLDFVFLDSTTVIALTAELEGYYPTALLKFNLLNNSWQYSDLNEYVYVSGLSFRTTKEIWGATGHNSKSFIVSKDSLKSWKLINTPDSLLAIDIEFADSLHGIAVGEAGYIFIYVPDSVVSVDRFETQVPITFVLEQNYPNPFNPTTMIQYAIGNREFVSIKVYDALGNEIATLVNEEKFPGSYSQQFTTEDMSSGQTGLQLNSGVYFYQLKAGNFVETKKMLLLK